MRSLSMPSTTPSPIFARMLYSGGCLRAALGLGLVLIALVGGIVLFSNGSMKWVAVNMSVATPFHPLALAVSPDQPTLFAVGTEQGQVFISHDAGSHWQMSPRAVSESGAVSALIFMGPRLVVGTTAGVRYSSDNAQTWIAGVGIPGGTIVDTLAPLPDGTILAGSAGQGIYRSRDRGATWVPSQNGLPAAADVTEIAALADGTQVFAAISGVGILQSADAGQSWTMSNSGLPDSAHFGTSTFAMLGGTASQPPQLFAGTDTGIYVSLDSGKQWAARSQGIGPVRVFSLVADPTSSGTLYAGTAGGVFRSTDSGSTWQTLNNGLPTAHHVSALVLSHPRGTKNATLFAASDAVYRFTGSNGQNYSGWQIFGVVVFGLALLGLVLLSINQVRQWRHVAP